jgi:hypothetical protein
MCYKAKRGAGGTSGGRAAPLLSTLHPESFGEGRNQAPGETAAEQDGRNKNGALPRKIAP